MSQMGDRSCDQPAKKTVREPLLENPTPKGGLRTIPFIIANEAFEKVASFGLLPNMVVYLTREYRLENFAAANVLFFWSAATNFFPIVGAVLADSYFGRYPMIGFGSIASLLGMILLWVTTVLPQARPPSCDEFDKDTCGSATTAQLLLLYSSFGLMSIGAGGIRSSALAFGADQLDTAVSSENSGNLLQKFFSWYYVSVMAAVMVAMTCVVYIQDVAGWKVGFGVPVMLMFVSTFSFFLASPFYHRVKVESSLLTRFFQVGVAAFKNRSIKLSSLRPNQSYHVGKGSMLQAPSEKLRFLNKACLIRDTDQLHLTDGKALDPWSLCTVDQVEELKSLINITPLWSTGIMMSVASNQNSFIVLLVASMDRHVTPSFEIPAGSFTMFMVLSLLVFVALYDRVFLRLASVIIGKPVNPSLKQRMGSGLALSIFATAALATVESVRRKAAMEEGLLDGTGVVKLSAMWLLLYFVLIGFAEGLNAIGQNQFYYSELPKTMSSVAATLFGVSMAVANLAASLIISIVQLATERGGMESWVGDNINKGHYDYYFWVITCFSTLNLVYFLACSKAYGPCKGEGGDGASSRVVDEEISASS
ncbi:protein NRT1/ PTR FAMILY 1.2 [Rhodamnia argentea]|uniref:Protein NRT1/ PTR FAMILY 1.2 n=1 Tax=Rhodamnia argentea TaxID=178133 RepID=A0A8B8P7U5_9MYRT|nr:protein NRT1/ PTR FAMILY 1.2 [Rhodamnia argentea]